MSKQGEVRLTVYIHKGLILRIDEALFVDGKWEEAVAPKNSPMGDIFPGWNYVVPTTIDTQLELKMMVSKRAGKSLLVRTLDRILKKR